MQISVCVLRSCGFCVLECDCDAHQHVCSFKQHPRSKAENHPDFDTFVLLCRHLSRISDCAWNANDPWMVASVAEDNMVHVWQMVSTCMGSCLCSGSSPVGHSEYLSGSLPPWPAEVSCLHSLQLEMCGWLLHFLANGSEIYASVRIEPSSSLPQLAFNPSSAACLHLSC